MSRLPTIAIVGAGRLAHALAPQVVAAGYALQAVVARRRHRAAAVVRAAGEGAASTSFRRAADARLVLVAVSDRGIAEVAEKLARAGDWSDTVALHHAGALGPDALAPLAAAGASVGVLHPLQAIGRPPGGAGCLPGSAARIEGAGTALEVARRLARDLGLVPLNLPTHLEDAERRAYHAAAALAANDWVALAEGASGLLEELGLPADEARRALAKLVEGTVRQWADGGADAALTGPAARGDDETVRAHLRLLRRRSPELAEVHRRLSRELTRRARELRRRVPEAGGPGQKPSV